MKRKLKQGRRGHGFTTTYATVPITTDVVGSNLDQGEVYSIMWSSLSVTFNRSVIFSRYSGFLHQLNWNIVEKGFKHHQTNKHTESWNVDVQQFHQYQQNEKLPLISNNWTQRNNDIWHWKSRDLTCDRNNNVVGLKYLVECQPSTSDN